VFGLTARDVSMSRLLAQLFQITALFDMRLRPELVLLQKTMVTVEGVARRIDPDNDIWAAAEPVVARWIARELSPLAKVRDFAREARAAVSLLARMAEPAPDSPATDANASAEPATQARAPVRAALWFFAGAAASAIAFTVGLALRLAGRL
jgi:ubiquinone biosynthesis protein